VPLPSEADIEAFAQRLAGNAKLLDRLVELRCWTAPTLFALEVGFDGERLTLPIRDADGRLINTMRYRPGGAKPKMLSWGAGHPRGLFPAPEAIPGEEVWVLEGEPDGITGRELGLPVVAVPGANGWKDEWATRLAGRRVVVVPDCDEPGRNAAQRIARSLVGHVSDVRLLDLDESRMDGYDLTDAMREGATAKVLRALAAEAPVLGASA
jgi:DNA primase